MERSRISKIVSKLDKKCTNSCDSKHLTSFEIIHLKFNVEI